TVHQRVQRGLGSCRRPAKDDGQLASGGLQHGIQEAAADPPPPRRLVLVAAAEVKGARGQLQHHARPARADLLGPKLVHTSVRPSWTTAAEKRAPPRLPCNPTAWRSTAVGSGPLESRVSAIRRAYSPRGAWRKSSGSPARS